jgi:hypothetical protein
MGSVPVHADDQSNTGKVFVIAMENHNWTQPASVTSPQQISGNPAAPFIKLGLIQQPSRGLTIFMPRRRNLWVRASISEPFRNLENEM